VAATGPREPADGWVLAVDFGTSNTGAAVRFADGRVEAVKLGSASDTMPSAVVLTTGPGSHGAPEKQWRVGQSALNARRTSPTTFVGSPKSRLGQEPVLLGDEMVWPAQLVAHVLTAVHARSVSAAGGTEPGLVVLTHPVGWGPARCDALRQAAVLAGFAADQVRLLPEPVAAFHAHGTVSQLNPGSRVAIVDIGGGTCDVAVLETGPGGALAVIAQAGDDRLGGNDLDDLVYRWVVDQLTASGQTQVVAALADPQNLGSVLTLLDTVRAAKQDLSEYATAPVAVAAGELETVVTITRDEYETLVAEPMSRAAGLLTGALHDSQTTVLHGLVLTGGTAYTPALARALHEITGILARPLGDPKLAVATGALRTPGHLMTALAPAGPVTPVPAPAGVTVLAGRYELGEVIGRGGVSQVHCGRDQLLGRQVAVKVPHAALAADPEFVQRFARGAMMVGKLNHPSVVRLYDIDTATVGNVEVPFIVMELVVGHPLTALIADRRPLPPDQALSIAADILTAVEFAHNAGVVHRDIKPSNVMLTLAGTVKVTDFAIARPAAETGTTTTKGVLGTPAYLSPEQALGRKADPRSDLYSAGCLLFEMLTGRPPFVGRSAVATAYAHITDTPPRPTSLNPHLPGALDDVLAKALAKDRDHRYQDAGTFRADLDAVRADPTTTPPGVRFPSSLTGRDVSTATVAVAPSGPTGVVQAAPPDPHAVPAPLPAVIPAPSTPLPSITPISTPLPAICAPVGPPFSGPSPTGPGPAPRRRGARVAAVVTLVALASLAVVAGLALGWW